MRGERTREHAEDVHERGGDEHGPGPVGVAFVYKDHATDENGAQRGASDSEMSHVRPYRGSMYSSARDRVPMLDMADSDDSLKGGCVDKSARSWQVRVSHQKALEMSSDQPSQSCNVPAEKPRPHTNAGKAIQ